MPQRRLGRRRLIVLRARPGLHGMSESFTVRRTKPNPSPLFIAPSIWVSFLDTADMYESAEMKSWWGARFAAAGMKPFWPRSWECPFTRGQVYWA